LYIAPDERSLWVVSGYNLKQLELPSFRLVKEWPLDVPRDAEVLDLRGFPESQVAVFRLYTPQERYLVVFDLKVAKTKLKLKRQGGSEDEIGADPSHVVFIGSDAPNEIICVDLLDPSKVWRKICPWPGVRVLGLSADDFTIAHSDGNIRHWSYSGKLLSKEPIAETNSLERIYPVYSGFFLMHDGLFSFRSDLAKSDDSATGKSIVVNSIALVGDNDFAVATTESEIQFRKTADNSLSRKLSLDADDLVVDEKSNRIFLRKETHLAAYDLKSLEKQGSVEIDGKLPFFISSARGGLVAATSEGVFVFDPRDLVLLC